MLNKLKALLIGLKVLLDGKKTYLAGIGLVATGLANSDYNQVLQGLGLVFLRQAITKG